ncbi:sn-glycerol-3-phosphate ABC transporter ATP-binding protein UgpC [candidate division WOR-3 bacterium]|nr:sn-glycerol-3-phosphate ABC transporter ATP-binding protein UgpC [candidate division WOR-3 bacterium]
MANVRLVALKKIYDKNVVGIEDINLEIEDKEFCVLVGPSGCGKSTTLRLIAGLETPTEGEIYIGNRLVNSVPPKDRDIAMVFQDYALYPHMTVFDNMAFALKLRKYSKEEIINRVSDVSKLLGIEELINRRPRALSGGQRQRVAVGRAIVRNPQIFLFDEPLSNLDAKLRAEMRTELKKLQRELGTTAVYVTHDQVEAMTMGDKIVILNEGLIQQIGDSKALYDNPINHFVAGFIGTPPMNFFQGIVDKGIFISSDGNIKMPLKRVDGKVTIGVRPEDIGIDTKGKIRARVELVEALGNEALLHLSIGEVRSIMRTYESPPKSDDTIDISFRSEKLHIFDTETGKRL